AAVVATAVADLRRAPDHKSELVSQALLGETLRLSRLSRDGRWVLARGEDGYPGYARVWSLAGGSAAAVRAWHSRARWRVDVPWLWRRDAAGGPLPFGARLVLRGRTLVGPLGPLTLFGGAAAVGAGAVRRDAPVVRGVTAGAAAVRAAKR